jgi:hypothetical protein
MTTERRVQPRRVRGAAARCVRECCWSCSDEEVAAGAAGTARDWRAGPGCVAWRSGRNAARISGVKRFGSSRAGIRLGAGAEQPGTGGLETVQQHGGEPAGHLVAEHRIGVAGGADGVRVELEGL